jgi:DNA-binding GntR family transcriptional regulator
MPPGERLYQDQLAREFDVSHIPVREALRQLGSEGLVTIEPHRGATVSELSRDELRQILIVRELLECELLKQALPNISERDLDSLQKQIDTFRTKPRAESYPKHNWAFHSTMYKRAELPLVLETVQRLNDMQQRYLRTELDFNDVSDQHQILLDIIRSRKHEEAISYLRRHIQNVFERLPIDADVPAKENAD